ncbi:hypothetical protein ACYOEI_08050 [Singulisphaera rosea]
MDPARELIAILEEARAFLTLPGNEFAWSSWRDAEEALREIDGLLGLLQFGALPNRSQVSVLFAPTGPIQEVSLSSGWGDDFLRLADRFDEVEPQLAPELP